MQRYENNTAPKGNALYMWTTIRGGQPALEHLKQQDKITIVHLQPIQLYILPLLYGLLGASAYVLRSITRAIQNLTYTVETNARYRLHIHLGALAGLAAGWFFSPSGASDSIGILSL